MYDKPLKTVDILGVSFASLTFPDALALLLSYLQEPRNHIITTPNPEGIMIARRNAAFAQAVAQADVRLADGTGVVLASRFRKTPLPQRVRGVDMAFALFEALSQSGGCTAYFLGGAPGIAERAKENTERRYPGVQVVGTHHGYFSPKEEQWLLADIREKKPDILLVCTGMPRAEIWVVKNRDLPARLTMCLGGTLNILSGQVKLAPSLWRKLGLEWAYRFITQPSRAKRMLDIPRFVWAVLTAK